MKMNDLSEIFKHYSKIKKTQIKIILPFIILFQKPLSVFICGIYSKNESKLVKVKYFEDIVEHPRLKIKEGIFLNHENMTETYFFDKIVFFHTFTRIESTFI